MKTGGIDRFVFEHVLAKLQSQREDIANLRNQAAVSAAISGLIANFFATTVSGQDAYSGPLWGFSAEAIVLFFLLGVSIGCSVLVVVRWYEFTFSFSGLKMLENMDLEDAEDNFFRQYVADGEWFFLDNETKIGLAQSLLFLAMVFGFAQMIPWILIIRGVGDV